ncbi:Pleckstrin homology domain-containing protein [Talaromyces proteolyticus]|uniref:Pleckstrin homology domain-containing protein n=1 Tax=Talaromyces proteolyticus TaxID=1131652 RepID=A0AAD4KSN4_9EURO|nr:Pleckstrin homology domain-containing protein [Talaromyces proteolyticus]KAH8697467.1 Pleckstrin homology domain-containing protein [Talaromyces proteolyticus]
MYYRSFRFAKRFFFFSDDAVEAKNLTAFLASEKGSAAAQRTAAWATQTGKGLLFYTKRAEDKATPAGIFNLSEVSDVNKDGSSEFSFKLYTHKHTFQAASAAERDSWVAALTAKTAEATAEKETITGGEGYKAELEKITKPAVVAAAVKAAPAPEKDAKEGEAAEDKKEEKKEEKKEDKKSRSQSRKRASIFGSILGKKEKEEVKEEAPATEAAPEAAAATEEPTVEAAPAVEATETPAVAAAEPSAETTETTAEDKKEEPKSATKSKRGSIFGNFFNKVTSPGKEKTEEEVAPVASTAPQLDSPVDESAAKPIEPEAVTDAPAAEAATETPAEDKKEEKEEAAAETKSKRTSIFGTLGKKVKSEVTSEEKKAANKLGGLFRKPSKAVKSEEKKDKEAAPAEAIPEGEAKAAPEETTEATPAATEAAETAAKTEEPAVAAEPVNVAPTAAPVQAAA